MTATTPDPAPLTCRELIEFLASYLDDEIDAAERTRFETHLGLCPDCVHYLDSYRETIRLGTAALSSDDGIPDDVPEELIQAVLASRRR